MSWKWLIVMAFTLFTGIDSIHAADAPVTHRIMLVEYGAGAKNRILDISDAGKITWEHRVPSVCVMFQPLPNGNVVFAYAGKPTGVQEVNREHKIVWNYVSKCEEIMTCERLPNGNTLAAEQGPCAAVEVNAKGEIVSTVKIPVKEVGAHRQVRCIHKLENGNYLAANEGDATVREVDPAGKVVWEYPGVTNVYEALRLPNGNTLIGCGTDKRIVEVDRDKKVVWELTAKDVPEVNLTWVTSLQILRNGNLVVCNFLRGQEGKGAHAFEVTREKMIVWTFADHKMVGTATMVRVVDELGVEKKAGE